ncbi:S8 family serine peptidase [Halobacillus yeomjeoni]|uniref:S8 family serine peptidase n=1 Tax=Halobacillus yeomjeoni TaxID=311194 RepID=A0A931HVT1_9BACI|nr:S8 family serine peptidase [Halobacillus yeomjeoni]MBH0230720.1 S8 family serine peptidase [Halobacillus yeomjeoni]
MNLKKSIVLFLIFMMAFSNAAFAAVPQSALKEAAKPQKQTGNVFEEKNKEKEFGPDDEVRIIVELEDEPTIYSAQSLGKSFSELSDKNKKKLQAAALEAQSLVKQSIKKQSIPMDYKQSFTTVFNGFSGTVDYKSIQLIEKLPNVGKVHIANEYERPAEEPEMLYSKELVKAQQTWQDYGYKGEGMVVGVIDTGIDPDHKDMVLSDGTETAITKEQVDTLKAGGSLDGKFFTDKVPFGYNYADENDTVLDLGPGASMHGMHVSGTVGANGDEDKGGIMGVAPEAQILGLKVFGNDPEMPSTWGDIYIKAIDDAILLGADVINMSLGSTASFVDEADPEQQAVARAVENGVMMSISAGNSADFGEGFADPFASNPDIGVVGAPGLSTDSLQVASFENQYLMLDGFNKQVDGNPGESVAFLSASDVHPTSLGDGFIEVEYAGLGRLPGDSDANPDANDFEGVDLEGKIALIQRGEMTFVKKTLNAQERGAAGVIIFNHSAGYVSMASDSSINIPQLFILKTDGELMRDQIQDGKTVEIAFKGEEVKSLNPENGKMSGFTSWGVTPNLDFKPEITAPGGNILSTLQDDQYGMMSGTSMAAPHVSGGSALMMQRVDEEFGLTGSGRVVMSKNILMNTSVPQTDKGTYNAYFNLGLDYSPRRQGAGLMDLHAAMSTPVVATEKNSGLGKVALKEMATKESFTLELENVTDENQVYNVDGSVQTDLVLGGSMYEGETQGIYKDGTISEDAPWQGEFPIEITSPNGSKVKDDYQVIVPANSKVEVNVTIDLENTVDWAYNKPLNEIFENGHFVEGFIKFVDPNDTNPTLNVPYVGFHGEWDDAPVVDATIYDKEDPSFYGETALLTLDRDAGLLPLGVDPLLGEDDELVGDEDRISFSPNGDGTHELALPSLSFLRNAKQVAFNVLDEDGNKLRTIRTLDEVRKNYFDGGAAPTSKIYGQAAWDGKVKGKVVEDGQYFYEVKSVIDFPDAEWQSQTIPVTVDTQAPSLEVTFDKDTGEVSWDAFDELSGLAFFDIIVNGESVLEKPLAADVDSYTLKEMKGIEGVKVAATDYAGNTATESTNEDTDDAVPGLHVLTPEALSTTNDKEVAVTGYVKDDSKVTSLTMNGKEAKLAWNAKEQRYDFSETLTYKTDGVKEIKFHAVDESGNDISFKRMFILDSTSPELAVEGPHTSKEKQVDLTFTMKDNFDDLRLFIDGSEVFKNVFKEPFEKRAAEETYTHSVTLEEGQNTFEVKLVDLGGNETVQKVTVYQSNDGPKNFDDVSSSFWGKGAIEKLNVAGVINGYPNGDFGINDKITRRDAARMIVRALKLDTTNVKDPGLEDVGQNDPAYKEIAAIAASGIMVGNPDGFFNPDGLLTRAEMAKVVVEAYNLSGSTQDRFPDVPLKHWAFDYINTLAANGISEGYPNGEFGLDNKTTRTEFAMFLARAEDDRFKTN